MSFPSYSCILDGIEANNIERRKEGTHWKRTKERTKENQIGT